MQCPVCDERMREVEKYGVTVDICPGCKGVWLDRGELEKLVQREQSDDARYEDDDRARSAPAQYDRKDSEHYREGEQDLHRQGQRPKPKRRSLLSDLLEGFGGD